MAMCIGSTPHHLSVPRQPSKKLKCLGNDHTRTGGEKGTECTYWYEEFLTSQSVRGRDQNTKETLAKNPTTINTSTTTTTTIIRRSDTYIVREVFPSVRRNLKEEEHSNTELTHSYIHFTTSG
jgi:hypothetical protein